MFKERDRERPEFVEVETAQAGVRKWLLLYRPQGIDGWIAHLLFYFCALSAVVLKIAGVLAAAGARLRRRRYYARLDLLTRPPRALTRPSLSALCRQLESISTPDDR